MKAFCRLREVNCGLEAIIDEHGPESVALYLGNPSAFNALGSLSAGMFAAVWDGRLAETGHSIAGSREGQFVRVRNEHGEVRTEVALDENLREGVVAMTHGFGNSGTTGMPIAQSMPSVSVNALSPVGPGSFDPLGGMSWLTGIQVEVEAA